MSSTARTALLAEWDRCRWVWNQCMAKSRAVHAHNQVHPGDRATCGPAQLDRMLTEARARTPWLGDGASVPQQQIIRDFAKARSKALKDIEQRLPVRQRAGMPRHKKKREATPSLNHTTRGFRLKDGRLHLAGGIVLTTVCSRELPAAPSSVRVYRDSIGHWYASFVVAPHTQPPQPAQSSVSTGVSRRPPPPPTTHNTTMDCASCGARTKHALPLSERTYTCTARKVVSPRDKNSARVMLVRAGLNPAGVEGVRPPGAPLPEAA